MTLCLFVLHLASQADRDPRSPSLRMIDEMPTWRDLSAARSDSRPGASVAAKQMAHRIEALAKRISLRPKSEVRSAVREVVTQAFDIFKNSDWPLSHFSNKIKRALPHLPGDTDNFYLQRVKSFALQGFDKMPLLNRLLFAVPAEDLPELPCGGWADPLADFVGKNLQRPLIIDAKGKITIGKLPPGEMGGPFQYDPLKEFKDMERLYGWRHKWSPGD